MTVDTGHEPIRSIAGDRPPGRWWRAVAVVATAVLVGAGCGDDGEPTFEAVEPTETEVTEASTTEATTTSTTTSTTTTTEAPTTTVDAAWLAGLEAHIEAGLDEAWAGQYQNHQVTCPQVNVAGLAAGDTFTCTADCECVPPRQTATGSDIRVTYEGDRVASWEEVLAPGASGPLPGGAPASGTYTG